MSFLRNFLPRQENFFQLFQRMADFLVESATEFHQMMQDLKKQEKHLKAIQHFEEEGDHEETVYYDILWIEQPQSK